jgi:hypothetical protein
MNEPETCLNRTMNEPETCLNRTMNEPESFYLVWFQLTFFNLFLTHDYVIELSVKTFFSASTWN